MFKTVSPQYFRDFSKTEDEILFSLQLVECVNNLIYSFTIVSLWEALESIWKLSQRAFSNFTLPGLYDGLKRLLNNNRTKPVRVSSDSLEKEVSDFINIFTFDLQLLLFYRVQFIHHWLKVLLTAFRVDFTVVWEVQDWRRLVLAVPQACHGWHLLILPEWLEKKMLYSGWPSFWDLLTWAKLQAWNTLVAVFNLKLDVIPRILWRETHISHFKGDTKHKVLTNLTGTYFSVADEKGSRVKAGI